MNTAPVLPRHLPDICTILLELAEQLRSGAKQGTRPMGIERLHMHRPIPARLCELPMAITSPR